MVLLENAAKVIVTWKNAFSLCSLNSTNLYKSNLCIVALIHGSSSEHPTFVTFYCCLLYCCQSHICPLCSSLYCLHHRKHFLITSFCNCCLTSFRKNCLRLEKRHSKKSAVLQQTVVPFLAHTSLEQTVFSAIWYVMYPSTHPLHCTIMFTHNTVAIIIQRTKMSTMFSYRLLQ
jgi:hypothetical protein